jgi:hypothetical protein
MVDVEAKREDTDALEARYGKVDIEFAIDWPSAPLTLGSLKEGGLEESGVSKGEALLVVMKTSECAVENQKISVTLPPSTPPVHVDRCRDLMKSISKRRETWPCPGAVPDQRELSSDG